MGKIKKITTTEKSVQRTLFFRRILFSFEFLFLLLFLVFAGIAIRESLREIPFVPPSYEKLDPESPDYWINRTLIDIDITSSHQPKEKKGNPKQRYLALMNTLKDAKKISSQYERIKAVSDIALTTTQNNIDINIDNAVLDLGDTPIALAARARILVSQGLMYLRIANRSAARTAFQIYDRLMIDADLKLNSEPNELAFFGAVTALAYLKDLDKLNEIFNREINYSLRVGTDQRMRAYRLIAGEQARVGMSVYAMNTAQKIQNPVERVRAYQLIIFYTARPQDIKPVEPEGYFLPKTEGPWEPIPAHAVAKQVIDDVLKQIALSSSLEEQVDLLTMLAGSRLMCDPELHQLLRECLANQPDINDVLRQPILQLLDEPRSELIRASLKLPPLPKERRRNVDTAGDDWTSPYGTLAVGTSNIKPALKQELADHQIIRISLMTSQCYQMVGRNSDAVQVLRKAVDVTKRQAQPVEQFQNMLKIGEHFLSAGDISEALTIFQDSKVLDKQDSPPFGKIIFREQISNLARLQIVGRSFEDALKTINLIEPKSYQNIDLAFLAMEQIRISRFEEAAQTIAIMMDDSQKQRLQHLSAIAQDKGEEHYNAVKIPYPEKLQGNTDLSRCCDFLIQNSLFGIAVKTAQKIDDPESQSRILMRIVREYVLLFKAYGAESEWHRSVRESLLNSAVSAAEKIPKPMERASAQEAILAGVLPFAFKENRTDFLLHLFDNAFKTCRQIDVPENKVELMGRLILSKITLEAGEQKTADSGQLLDKTSNAAAVDEVDKLISETIEAVNKTKNVSQRGYAQSFLAKALEQIGQTQEARTLLDNAEETAKNLSDKRESISILLSLIPILRALDDSDKIRKIYSLTFTIVADSFIEMPNSTEVTVEWRQRDAELKRIIRSLLEQNYIVEAVVFTDRIYDPQMRDPLLRAAAYIYMDEGNFVSAEKIVRKIELSTISETSLWDVLFMKRRQTETSEENQSESTEKDEDIESEEIPSAEQKPAIPSVLPTK